jgi:hypothetical protein
MKRNVENMECRKLLPWVYVSCVQARTYEAIPRSTLLPSSSPSFLHPIETVCIVLHMLSMLVQRRLNPTACSEQFASLITSVCQCFLRIGILSFIEQKDGMGRIMYSSWFENCTVKLG